MRKFTRNIKPELLKQLKDNKIFNDKLSPDVKSGNVFAALRNNEVDFYYKGGKLFSFNNKGLSTHVKYATTPEDNASNYVTENEFSQKCRNSIKDFNEDYDKIKNNCKLYSKGTEAACVSYLYKKYSFINISEDIIILDIEVSLKSEEDSDKNQDRIDILLYSNRERALKFIEAKLYTNKEIRSTTKPAVIKQVEGYGSQIKNKKNEILDAYKNYINVMNGLFSLNIKEPTDVLPGAGLYIFGFDDDQKKGNLCQIEEKLKENNIKYYSLGNPENIKIQALWKATH